MTSKVKIKSNFSFDNPSTNSSSDVSPKSNQDSISIDQDTTSCTVYWDHYQPIVSINQIQSKLDSNDQVKQQQQQLIQTTTLLKTPSKSSSINPTSISKRNSSIAGIPSPSKPQTNHSDQNNHLTRKSLRDHKRRKDKPPNELNKSSHQISPQIPLYTHTTPLPPRQRDALDALANRISLRKKSISIESNLSIPPNPKLNYQQSTKLSSNSIKQNSSNQSTSNQKIQKSNSPSLTSLKGKQADTSKQAPTHLFENQNHDSITCKIKSIQPVTHSDVTSTKPQSKSNQSSSAEGNLHHTKPNSGVSASKSLNQKLQNTKGSTNSTLSNQNQAREDSNLKQSIKPSTSTRQDAQSIPSESTTTVKSPAIVAVSSEPWDVEEDDEFGSQLLELVDLVEKKQHELSPNSELIKETNSAGCKGSKTNLTKPPACKNKPDNPQHNDSPLKSFHYVGSSEIQVKLNSKPENQSHQVKLKSNLNHVPNITHSMKQSPIIAAYKNTCIVSKPIVSNQIPIRSKNDSGQIKSNHISHPPLLPHYNGLKKLDSFSTEKLNRVGRKSEVIAIGMVKNCSKDGKITSSIGFQSSKISCTKSNHHLQTGQKMSYSNALIADQFVKKIDQNVHDSIPPHPIEESLDLDLLFSGIVGEDLDWDPNE